MTAAAVSWWDREQDTMRTLVNVGALHPSESELPEDEGYPLDALPAVAALLRFGRPYIEPQDLPAMSACAERIGRMLAAYAGR